MCLSDGQTDRQTDRMTESGIAVGGGVLWDTRKAKRCEGSFVALSGIHLLKLAGKITLNL